MSRDRRLVFSTDPKDRKCPKCGWFQDECKCSTLQASADATKPYTVIFRLEKSGRGGKTVTVMEGWPRNEAFLKDMARELKAKCGSGGTHLITPEKAVIEIQGDKRDSLKKVLTSKGISFKGM